MSSIFAKPGRLAALFIIVASVIAIASAWHDAPIVDEDPHIGAGYSYIAGQTYQFNPEHPPLAKDLAGLALATLSIPKNFLAQYNLLHPGTVNDQWNFGRQLIYHSGVTPTLIIHVAKLPEILFFILGGILVFAWTRRTYNSRAALIAVFLFAFSPTVVAHSRFVTTDVPALFGVLLATYFFLQWLQHRTRRNLILAWLTFGVALLTKFSTFLLTPYFLVLALIWGWLEHRKISQAIWLGLEAITLFVASFVLIVGPVYLFHIQHYSAAQQKKDSIQILQSFPGHISDTIIWASDKSILRPYAQYGLGLAMATQRVAGGNQVYFLNQLSGKSFWSYFPIVFLLKEPIPFLILFAAAIWIGFRSWFRSHQSWHELFKNRFDEFAMLLWLLTYAITSITGNLNIGIRHLMPMYGFLFILTAGQIEPWLDKKRARLIIGLLLVWYLAEFVSVYPSYLAYFNEFAGGPAGGYHYVADSNLDWGQDLWRLGDYIKQNNIQRIYLDYFGWAEQEYYLGAPFIWLQGGTYNSAAQFFAANPSGGWIAVSATYYDQSSLKPGDNYYWLKGYKPTAVIGHSIFVWHLTR